MQMQRWNPWWTGDPDPTYLAKAFDEVLKHV